jgi:hypothetical protein
MPTLFELQWQPNIADSKAGMALGSWGSAGRLARTALLLFVLPSVWCAWLVHRAAPAISTTAAVALGIVAGILFGALFLALFGALFARQLVRTERARGETQVISISEEGVERRSLATTVRHPWSAITRVDELPQAFLLISGTVPIGSIEKSGIASEAELQQLRSFICSKKPVRRLRSTFLALSIKAPR